MTVTTTLPMVVKGVRPREWAPGRWRWSDRPDGKSIVFVEWGDLDQDIMQQIMNRRSRPFNLARPHVEAALREYGITFDKLRWSRYAGCTCPCSGGFIIEGGIHGRDFWVGAPEK